ncbi:MAG: nuclear transport factor 2 family protein [Chitinophagales bacterium]|jgi:hypothetical protein|nr:nuclear transport factor 2 family protein [Bacteroidota bacterium]MBP8915553.1 nuclear transport factor 2 family protein [Chitinophagales bacterium]MBP9220681.1 nuclear transport factor 2 family protein [Chitinophagales bacterium]MBP9794684.1 nuclear transport factor 2 family protein [Chitinophagales bacterium]
MKSLKLTIMLTLVSATLFGQNTNKAKEEISTLVTNFSSAVENRDTLLLDPLLNENFRVVALRFPTPDKTTVLSKEKYIFLLSAGKIGGEKRSVEIINLDISEYVATAKVVFESDKMIFTTYQTYILNSEGKWQIISDIPVTKNK